MFAILILVILIVLGVGLFFVARLIYENYYKNKIDMENLRIKFTQTLTFKAIMIALLILVLLIPGSMIQDLIKERQERSRETIQKINDKWSRSQTLCAPLLLVPYTTTKYDNDKQPYYEKHTLYITPKDLKINASLTPVERHYGIYKAILYKSDIYFEGNFSNLANIKIENSELHFDKAHIAIGITDLRGVVQNPNFKVNGKSLETTIGVVKMFSVSENVIANDETQYGNVRISTKSENISGKTLIVNFKDTLMANNLPELLNFNCSMKLNGSSFINFIPIGHNTNVTVDGKWNSPSFIGSFSPESTIEKGQFNAVWNILSFNREIPETWTDNDFNNLGDNFFGVNLIEPVDHYQQNMRSAKYDLMFIALTFIVFFFVEILTKKPIHLFQYILVGLALILFYSLLLSFSEQIGFSWAYLIASSATILLTTIYFYSLIKQMPVSIILGGILIVLYAFLYIILQIEDFALIFGSIFLFIILGIIMFVSNKINIGKHTTNETT